MSISVRTYEGPDDFNRVSDLLVENYQADNRDGNWLQPAWEYMHCHPALDEASLGNIGIWQADGRVVGVAHYESRLGEAFFEVRTEYAHLKPWMLEYAEAHLYAESENGQRTLRVYVNDFDRAFEDWVKARGYQKDERRARPMSRLLLTQSPRKNRRLPDGFRIRSLAEANDLLKIQRVLWRGFNHPGDPPADEIEGHCKLQSGPHFRKDLTLVVEALNGDYASFCGMWYEPHNQIAYVEPMATDPAFRRIGLGAAALGEGIRRCGELGATVVFVGSDQAFYRTLGFETVYTSHCWARFSATNSQRNLGFDFTNRQNHQNGNSR
jgi:predicted N-acetyltransferase YhbS